MSVVKIRQPWQSRPLKRLIRSLWMAGLDHLRATSQDCCFLSLTLSFNLLKASNSSRISQSEGVWSFVYS